MLTSELIIKQIEANMGKIKIFGIKKIGLFGSFITNEQKSESDIDILVEFKKGKKTFDNFIHLNFFLEKVFKRRVELVTSDSLSPYIGPHILKEVEYASFSS